MTNLWSISSFSDNSYFHIKKSILVNRLRPLLNDIISPLQNAFVLKRLISDNSSLAQEILNAMKLKKCKTSFLALKIDLEKAYDRIEWNFIRNALTFSNFPIKFIEWIMMCFHITNFHTTISTRIGETRVWRKGQEKVSSWNFTA